METPRLNIQLTCRNLLFKGFYYYDIIIIISTLTNNHFLYNKKKKNRFLEEIDFRGNLFRFFKLHFFQA
jgi:hypothetical protein